MNLTEDVITLQVPASAEYIDLVRLTLYGLAVKMGFSYEEIEDMKVAVSEACNNAVLYAYGDLNAGEAAQAPTPPPRIEVRLVKKDDALSIIVKDDGRSFDAVAAARRASRSTASRSRNCKRGDLGTLSDAGVDGRRRSEQRYGNGSGLDQALGQER